MTPTIKTLIHANSSPLHFMSCFGLKKPIHTARKAWIRLATKLRQSKPVAAILPSPPRRRRRGRPVSVYDGDKVMLKTTKEMVGSSSSTSVSRVASSAASASVISGEYGEVDMRAEMFIARFKEELRLQRQASIVEYQEMLARGV